MSGKIKFISYIRPLWPFCRFPRKAVFRSRLLYAVSMLVVSVFLQGCFTGIESTKQIKLSKDDRKAVAPTAEELFLSGVTATPYGEWPEGKPFVVVGDRGSVLFEPKEIVSGNYTLTVGDTLRFRSSRIVTLPDGAREVSLLFSRGRDEFSYIPQSRRHKGNQVMSDAIPGIVDPEMIEKVGKLLVGKTLWTRTPVWMAEGGRRIDGRKFERVKVTSVSAGTMVFPLKVGFIDENGKDASILMNFGSEGKDSRSFANMFSLSYPRESYSDVSEKYWENIRRGRVEVGMTKEECRLAKGNPSEVNSGRDYSHTLLIWGYADGTVLYFVDGILRGINDIPKDY